jgi:peptide/nickel transport system permease protein
MDQSADKLTSSTFSRVAKYLTFRAIILFGMVAIGVFLTVVIVNYGGYIDNIHRADIDEALSNVSLSMVGASVEKIAQVTEQLRSAMEEAYGLHKPFLLRCVRWWYQTMTLNWGVSYRFGVDRFATGNATDVRLIVLSRVPYTLMLAGATNILLFFASIFVALNLSKKYGTLLDKIIITLSPLSSIPNWVYGIILTVIFAGELHILPFNGLYDTFPPATKLGYIPIVLKHMILPVSAIFLGMFFSTVYTWRTFFLIHSGEDYLEMAKAKGLPARIIERRYVLKPTLPYIITSFSILIITFWQGIIVLEVFFRWPGLGQLFMTSILVKDMAVTIGIVVVFAALLALSVFLMDIIYALVDPRIKIGGSGQTVRPVNLQNRSFNLETFLKPLNRLRNAWQYRRPAGRNQILPLSKQYTIRPAFANQSSHVSTPVRFAPLGRGERLVANGYCLHLKLENNRGQVLQAASYRCRCYVHGRPERVGNAFQAKTCRTRAYRRCPRLVSDLTGYQPSMAEDVPSNKAGDLPKKTGGLNPSLREFFRYPAAVVGVMIIIALIGISIYAVITIPYKKAIELWGPESVGKYQIPKNALPAWINLFRKDPLPSTIIKNSRDDTVVKLFNPSTSGVIEETITYTIDYPYGGFPQDMIIIFDGQYEKKPFVSLTWVTPDGREFELGNFTVVSGQRFLASQNMPKKYLAEQIVQTQDNILSGVGGPATVQILFKNPAMANTATPVNRTYTLRIDAVLFEKSSNLDAELILYGQVYGLAGTDDHRRDLMVALLWGTPVALAFGFLGAVATSILSMVIAGIGSWFNGWVDGLIQRITEVNMILPALPIAITIFYLYSKSIWVILGVLVLLSIFGSSIKTYRAAFLQVKELPYIEAAQAYGASNWRIIRHYLVPRIIPLLIPQLVIMVPSYVFFEATLAYLNVSDPTLPTWGKVVYDALTRGAFQGYYYWVLEPVALMILTGLAFAVVGFALDSILNPRLRRI